MHLENTVATGRGKGSWDWREKQSETEVLFFLKTLPENASIAQRAAARLCPVAHLMHLRDNGGGLFRPYAVFGHTLHPRYSPVELHR